MRAAAFGPYVTNASAAPAVKRWGIGCSDIKYDLILLSVARLYNSGQWQLVAHLTCQ
jgi:hypothetical protein